MTTIPTSSRLLLHVAVPALLIAAGCAAPAGNPTAPSTLQSLSGVGSGDRPSVAPLLSGPNIEQLWWKVELPTGGDPPIPGDPVWYGCRVSDADGDVVEISIEETNRANGHVLWRDVQAYQPQSVPLTIVFRSVLRDHPGTKIGVRVTCRAVDSQGQAAIRSIDLD